ncbi:hypothetical protein BC835DRAFT_1414870 [Cytidiella melzeri]|nr:hypothetical protein BC835DRAFT_1414870 [Cytidiella melzeri]
MSLSTTSTTAYVLTKYSRAYPSHTNTTDLDAEWQHYTNPVIRLVLDLKKKGNGELESYRVRVLWSINQVASLEAMDVDRHDVVFEDVDLLSFSPLNAQVAQRQNFSIHGLPLKAVYRDAVVGVRYMHPPIIGEDARPSYRRFQVNFQQPSDATSFVEAIRHICPCKAHGPAPGLSGRSMTVVPNNAPVSSCMQPPNSAVHSAKGPLRPAVTMQATPQSNIETRLSSAQTTTQTQNPSSRPHSIANARSHAQQDETSSGCLASALSTDTSSARSCSQIPDTTVPLGSRFQDYAPSDLSTVSRDHSTLTLGSNKPAWSRPNFQDSLMLEVSDANVTLQSPSYLRQTEIRGSNQQYHAMLSSETGERPPAEPALVRATPDAAPRPSLLQPIPLALTPALPFNHSKQIAPQLDAPTATSTAFNVSPSADVTSSNTAQGHSVRHTDSRLFPQQCSPTSSAVPPIGSRDLTASLREEPTLYTLPRDELESLVASIIREDGFMDFLKTVDSLWRVKAFVNSTS